MLRPARFPLRVFLTCDMRQPFRKGFFWVRHLESTQSPLRRLQAQKEACTPFAAGLEPTHLLLDGLRIVTLLSPAQNHQALHYP